MTNHDHTCYHPGSLEESPPDLFVLLQALPPFVFHNWNRGLGNCNLYLADKFSIVSTAPEEKKVKVAPSPIFTVSIVNALAKAFKAAARGTLCFNILFYES